MSDDWTPPNPPNNGKDFADAHDNKIADKAKEPEEHQNPPRELNAGLDYTIGGTIEQQVHTELDDAAREFSVRQSRKAHSKQSFLDRMRGRFSKAADRDHDDDHDPDPDLEHV